MGETTKIEFARHTASPWYGCQHAELKDGTPHRGCLNCYAERMAKRNPSNLGVWGDEGRRVLSKSFWPNCRKWNRQAAKAAQRERVFLSMCDPFEDWRGPMQNNDGRRLHRYDNCYDPYFAPTSEERPATMNDARRDLFALIDECPWLDFLLFTKRSGNVPRMWQATRRNALDWLQAFPHGYATAEQAEDSFRPNVWIIYSASDQASFDSGVDALNECSGVDALNECDGLAAVLGISAEPMVGPINASRFTGIELATPGEQAAMREAYPNGLPANSLNVQWGRKLDARNRAHRWIVCGGESGSNAAPLHPDFPRSLRDQCVAASMPFFFKQHGESIHESQITLPAQRNGKVREWLDGTRSIGCGKHAAGRLLDGREWNGFPSLDSQPSTIDSEV